MAIDGKLIEDTVATVIQRADELAEFLSIYWDEKKQTVSHPVQRGLARAFKKFDEYQLAKYNRPNAIKLRDVLFLCHARPDGEYMDHLWKKLIGGHCANCWGRDPEQSMKSGGRIPDGDHRLCVCGNYTEAKLAIPKTWETELSAGKDKKEVWTELLLQKKIGALALLRNLRNMIEAGVPRIFIIEALTSMRVDRVLPYRFIAAARYAVGFEPELEKAMLRCLTEHETLPGHTVLLVDVSGSMTVPLSSKSDLLRMDAACGLAMLLREIGEQVDIFTFSETVVQVPPRRGFALRDAITASQPFRGTYMGMALKAIYGNRGEIIPSLYSNRNVRGFGIRPDRVIVITDEQAHDTPDRPQYGKGYIINVAPYKNGVGYGPWNHVDGFSESVIDWILEYERLDGV